MCSQGYERYNGNTLGGGASNHNMASDFRVSSRSNDNTDGRCDREKAGGSGVLRHLDSSNNLMMVGGSVVLRHLDSSIDAMDLIEGGVGQGTCFCEGSPASNLDSRQDMVPPSPVFGLAHHAGNALQVQDGIERLIGFGSFVLDAAQRNYCTTRKELLAVVRFTIHCKHYLLVRAFTVRTDHSSLTWLMGFNNIEG